MQKAVKVLNTHGGSFLIEGEAVTWANYMAVDEDGEVWIYEFRPMLVESCWIDLDNGRCQYIGKYTGDLSRWKEFLRDV